MENNPHNTISQPAINYYNKYCSFFTEDIFWIKTKTSNCENFKINIKQYKQGSQLLYFNYIYIFKTDALQFKIVTMEKYSIVDKYFAKVPLTW